MKNSIKKLLVICLTFSLILTQIFFTREAKAGEAQRTVKTAGSLRLGGSDRYKTSVAISQKGWSSSQYVVLASGIEFPDALCAGPLAKKYGAPILLTQSDKLNLDTLNEIKRLGARNIIIIGGNGSISKNIEDELKSEGITSIERISGTDRYETSVKVAEKIGTTGSIALASGLNFPDALSFSPIATTKGIPIVLTNKDSLPACVKQYLSDKKITQSYIVGGTGVISESVKNLVSNPLRLGGLNRYETNVEILKAFDKDLNYNSVYISGGDGPNGNEFADALSGAVLAARTSSPIILAYKSLPDLTKNYIKTKFSLGSKTIALGGEASIASSILNDMSASINEIPVSAVYDKSQTYGSETVTTTVSGNAVISIADVTLKNVVIEGDLLLGEGIGNGNVYLNNVTVKGKTIVNGGGPNSVVLINFNGEQVVVDIPDGHSVRLLAQGSTNVGLISMNTSGKLEESNDVKGNGFSNVIIPNESSVTLLGSFNNVDVQSNGASVDVNKGEIENLNIAEGAYNSSIKLAASTKVNTLNLNTAANITGTGTITQATINSSGATIEQKPSRVIIKDRVTATVGGQQQGSAAASQEAAVNTSNNITLSVTGVSGKVILSSTAMEMQSGDTAYSVLIRKLGSKVSAKGSGYVRGIDGLKELDYGPLSGWMYSVNGKFPNVSADSYTLKNGDIVAWCYTKNMGQDIGAPMSGANTGSGSGIGSVTTPTDNNTNGKLVDIKGDLSFTLAESANKTITIQSNSNNNSDSITVTLYDSNGNLAYINQCSNGTMQLNTILAPEKYHGFVKASSMDKVTISEFQVN